MTRALIFSAALTLGACGGGSTTGGGTANSPFVGTYNGSSTATVAGPAGVRSASESISVFVHHDGLVQIGAAGSTIYASGPLQGDRVRIEGDAAALVDGECSGTIVLAGEFSLRGGADAAFAADWSSGDVSCFGAPGELGGTIRAERVQGSARASRVFETSSPALLRAFRQAAG